MTLVASAATAGAGPGEPVPVAFLGRTSTLEMQDPVASLRRQIRASRAWLPPGWFISAWYWDVESGGLDLEARGHGTAWRAFTGAGLPRDGGLADLLAEAASPAPRFAAVICEDIERSGRDTFNALRLEKKLSRSSIPLFATDEPAVIDGVNATTVLVRRMKQGVAEWFRLQLKEKTWKGLVEHALDGWNIGPAPYGYRADRIAHPVPAKASQGRTKTRLAPDPQRAPVVEQIFTWRVVHKLGMPTIAARLNADPARYPAPAGSGWTAQSVFAILRNPKYSGHMVYGRIRTRNGRRVTVPDSEWLWSPEPVHPAIIDRATWHAAQAIGAEHATSRDGDGMSKHPAATRTYPYRGRIRCRDCRRRMGGLAYGHGPDTQRIYYQCPHNPAKPRETADRPGHPRTVKAPETRLDQIVSLFFAEHVFGPGRAQLLAALWNKPGSQATVFAEITDATLQALPGILNPGQDGYDDTSEESACDPAIVEDLFETPIDPQILHEARILHDKIQCIE
jgi:DNA invertase Pin-like site-specific DNA recombinase